MKELILPKMTYEEKLELILLLADKVSGILSNADTFNQKMGNRNIRIFVEYNMALTDKFYFSEEKDSDGVCKLSFSFQDKYYKARMLRKIETNLEELREGKRTQEQIEIIKNGIAENE